MQHLTGFLLFAKLALVLWCLYTPKPPQPDPMCRDAEGYVQILLETERDRMIVSMTTSPVKIGGSVWLDRGKCTYRYVFRSDRDDDNCGTWSFGRKRSFTSKGESHRFRYSEQMKLHDGPHEYRDGEFDRQWNMLLDDLKSVGIVIKGKHAEFVEEK